MLERSPIDCNPKIVLNPNKDNFFEFEPDDVVIEDYPRALIKEKNPQLKFDIGI